MLTKDFSARPPKRAREPRALPKKTQPSIADSASDRSTIHLSLITSQRGIKAWAGAWAGLSASVRLWALASVWE